MFQVLFFSTISGAENESFLCQTAVWQDKKACFLTRIVFCWNGLWNLFLIREGGREGGREGREGKGREGKGREGKGREGEGRGGEGREGKGREGKGREGKGRGGKGRGNEGSRLSA